jgi:hypothetical protein
MATKHRRGFIQPKPQSLPKPNEKPIKDDSYTEFYIARWRNFYEALGFKY